MRYTGGGGRGKGGCNRAGEETGRLDLEEPRER